MRRSHFLVPVLVLLASTALLPAAQTTCAPTRPDAEGPFYKANAPERSRTVKGFVVTGAVKSASACVPRVDPRIVPTILEFGELTSTNSDAVAAAAIDNSFVDNLVKEKFIEKVFGEKPR